MCGIAGYYVGKPLAEAAGDAAVYAETKATNMATACAALAHRGPDETGQFEDPDGCVGLVHTRLSILDLSPTGHQPMIGADGQVVLVFNGEIYNFRELRKELMDRGFVFGGNSDTEVLLNLYLAEGQDPAGMLKRLNGIFAFALWDARTRTMLIARDALGVKPLYVAETPDRLVFASEIKALGPLLGKEDGTQGLDYESLARYLTFLWCPGQGTPFEGVRKLQPGEFLLVREGNVIERCIWYSLPVFRSTSPRVNTTHAIAGVAAKLRVAVHRQMVADVPVGAFLSGGLDSSSVVAFARELDPEIRCFTIETPGGVEKGTVDDLPYARRVAAHLKVPLDVVSVSSQRMADELEAMVAHLDEPLADPAPLNVLFISRMAREQGIKVLLSGAGGDDLFAGYRRHRALMAERYWSWMPQVMRHGIAGLGSRLDQRNSTLRRVSKMLDVGATDGDSRLAHYFFWTKRDDLLKFLTEDFRRKIVDVNLESPLTDFLASLPKGTSPLDRMLAIEQRFFLADHNLVYTDKMSMAVGVEVRVPFLDLDLVEFSAGLADETKLHNGVGKWVLKKAMEAYLPMDVVYRPKTGFGAPLRRWMRVELRELLCDVLSEYSLRRRGLFEPSAVKKLIDANSDGRVDASYTLLSMLCIELWCRRFIDRPFGDLTSANSLAESSRGSVDPRYPNDPIVVHSIKLPISQPAYRLCTKLVMDTSDPDISFDDEGICSHYWDFQKNVKPRWDTGPNGRRQLEATIARIKEAGKGRDFDCIMGMSGGADSSYMLHLMVTEFGLRPLVFHVDGGWNSELAVHNINAMIDKLGLDLYTEVINWEEMRNFQLAMFKSGVPHIDIPQDHAFIGVLYKFARQHGIKYILNGGNISTECARNPLKYFYWGTDMVQIRNILSHYGQLPMRSYPFSSIFYHKVYLRYLRGVKVIKPLNFVPYVKQDAMDLMEREYGWKPYSQKHFESRFTRFFEGYWLPTRFGFDVRRVQFSSLILTGQMTRDEALAKLEQPPYDPELIEQDFGYIATKLGISKEELRGYHEMPKKFYWDYRNQRAVFDWGERVLWHVAGNRRGGGY